jgi:23S rRNA (pseudouridine1915-N3)-methyltransferase
MKIQLICIGRTREGVIEKAIEKYTARIPYYIPFELVIVPDIKTTKSMTEVKQKELEGERILASTERSDFVMLLDERGKELTSREFADFISKKSVILPRNLVFVIGGPYGFSKAVYDRADAKLSLSKMTFPHELVRLFFVEQVYRACTINRGEPYHHD